MSMDTKGREDKPRFGIVNFERRKYPRFSIDLPIEYYRTESPIPASGRAGDISEGGLLVYLSERIEVGEQLKVRCLFTSISESMKTMETLAEVVWVVLESLETNGLLGSYKCGLRFIKVNPMDMEKLKFYLKSLAQP
jgi:c-di-GMP-binding flagellar brake protein YcgR